jgi:hypothetical protein
MSTLGLSGQSSREESRWKQIFWPEIKHPQDVDLVATQGFWICMVVAVLSLVFMLISSQMLLAVWVCLIFFLGGIGIRQTSIAGAVAVFLVYLFQKVAASVMVPGGAFGVVDYFVLAVLLSNVRGTVKASEWKHRPELQETELEPARFNDTWRDKLCDQMPPKVWPWGKYLFFTLVVGYLGLSALGVGVYVAHRHAPPAADVIVR